MYSLLSVVAYYRAALGAMLVYDVAHRPSFDNIPRWLNELKEHAAPSICVILVANKVDLAETQGRQVVITCFTELDQEVSREGEMKGRRIEAQSTITEEAPLPSRLVSANHFIYSSSVLQVTTEEGQAFATQQGLLFIETSARQNYNVDVAFQRIIQEIYKKVSSFEGPAANVTTPRQSVIRATENPASAPAPSSGGCCGFSISSVVVPRNMS